MPLLSPSGFLICQLEVKDSKILGDDGTGGWRESGCLNHWKATHRLITLAAIRMRSQLLFMLSLKCRGWFVTAASIILANILILCVLSVDIFSS